MLYSSCTKVLLVVLAMTALCFVTPVAAGDEDYAPFVTFNGGLVSPEKSCTDAEMAIIASEVAKVSMPKPASASASANSTRSLLTADQTSHNRELQLLKCMPLMAWATAKCGGARARRHRQRIRSLGSSACAANITKFNAALDAVKTKVSAPCQGFIATRSYACRESMVCDIKGIDYWNADDDYIERGGIDSHVETRVLCNDESVNFEADTTFDVGNVQFMLRGTGGPANGYHYSIVDYESPYFIFGKNGTNVLGAKLKVGNYTFTAVAANAPTLAKTFRFRVKDCT